MIDNFQPSNIFETQNHVLSDGSAECALLVQQKIQVAVHLFMFLIGFILFEWGNSRTKSAEASIVKHMFLFMSASILTFLLGFALAFGEPHLIGTRYFLSIRMLKDSDNPENSEMLALNYLLLILSMTVTSTVAVSSINERQSIWVQVALGVYLQVFLLPIVTAWTHGGGFLNKLYLEDQSGCISFHLFAGIAAMLMSSLIQPRLGRFEPLTILHDLDSDESDGEERIVLSSAAVLHTKSQRKIDKVARGLDMQVSDKHKNFNYMLEKVRKAVSMANNDGFFSRNSDLGVMLGTILMWFGLAHSSAGITQSITDDHIDSNQIVINFFIAGVGGALGAHITSKVLKFFKLKKEKKQFENYLSIGVDFDQQRAVTTQRKQTYFMNLDCQLDMIVISRGIISGAIAISVSPSNFFTWAALINGSAGGGLYVMSCKLLHIFEIDDTTHISQCHGFVSLWSLVSIILFHKTEGFFFNTTEDSMTTLQLQEARAQIMVILGSNSLAVLTVIIITIALLFPMNYWGLDRFSRVSKVQELLGQDTFRLVRRDLKLRNHCQELINEYYPDNVSDYLLSKHKLLMKVKSGSS